MADCIDQRSSLAGGAGRLPPDARPAPREFYQHLFNANPAPTWVFDAQTLRFLAVNDAVVIRYGYAREELLRLTIRDVILSETAAWLAEEIATDALVSGESLAWDHRTKASAIVSLEAVATQFEFEGRPAWLVVGTEATERRRTEAALRASEERLRNVLAHIPCGVFWKDRASIYLGCNDRVARDCGFTVSGEVVGRTDDELTAFTEEAELSRMSDQQVIDGGAPLLNVEETRTRPDGTKATLLTSRVPMADAHGRVVGVLGVYQDVTELKRLEAQFRQSQKMEAIGRLAGGVAHDFNNLLTIISGNVHLLQNLPPDDLECPVLIDDIRDAAERAATLTRQLLTFSRKQPTRPDVFDLNAIVTGFAGMVRRLIGDKTVIETRLSPRPVRVRVDRSQMEQVLLNLAVNAKDAMPGGGTLTISTGELSDGARFAYLKVADTGCGMSDEVKKHLFEPFFTTKDVGKGTGLGLATVYGIVEQARGKIDVESAEGAGTTFTVRLPWCDAAPKSSAVLPAVNLFTRTAGGARSVLLVEDEERLRKMMRFTLEGQGYTVAEANGGEAALRLLAADHAFDLLVTDMVMPGIDGRELATRVRALRPGVGVVFVSGFVPDQGRLEGLAGATYLPKPFTPLDLVKIVEKALRPRK